MRRRGGWLTVLGLLLWACSSGGVRTTSDTSDTTDTTTRTSAGEAAEAPGDPVGGGDTAAPAAGTDVVPLPGLVDDSDEPIPNDDAVRTGTLANGLVYYVRQNDNPGGKADLRLAIRAGSVDELGTETGVAHFAEHMLFNGTEKYPENELVDTLRSFGAAFGADVNAFTTYDETVYTLTVPNTDESVRAGLDVLEQWLSHATFDEAQVVAERGVVLDEWRVRTQTTRGRLFDVAQHLFLSGSAYDGRAPIGTQSSIEGMPRDVLVDYYDTWYRPDNAAIVVVGDIVVDEIVDDLERLFGPAAPRTPSAPARPDTTFDVDLEADVGLHVDPDQQTVDVEVTLPLPAVSGTGTRAARAAIIDAMIHDALVRRLRHDLAAGVAPFDDVTQGTNSLVDTLDAPALYAFTDAERADDTLSALLDEYERAFRYGFTSDETDLARETVRSTFDARFDGRESHQDGDYAAALVDAFLDGASYPSIPDEHAIATATLDAVTPEAMATRFAARWTNAAPHVIISTPESVATEIPTEAEVLDTIAGTSAREVPPRPEQRRLPEALMARPPGQAPLSIESVVPRGDVFFDPVRMVYPNGTTVILNTNTIVEGQVFYQGASPGGSSLVADADVVDALYAADIVTSSGLADFDRAELDRITAGTDTEVGAWIDPYVDHLAGSAATADLEVLLQQLHLSMTRPRVDVAAFNRVRSQVEPVVADPTVAPNVAGDDALLDIRYPGELRYAAIPEPAEFATLDLEGVERVWGERYGDASDWVFVFSGDFDMDVAMSLTDAYLGTLPGSGTIEGWVDVGNPPPPGVNTDAVTAGAGDTATVRMLFTSPIPAIDAELRVTADVATEVIQARLTDVIREELGESYSPSAVSFVSTDPDPVIETFVFVTGAPDRIASIADLVVAELDDIGTTGPSEQEYVNAFARVREGLNFVDNGSFVQELVDAEIHPARDLGDFLLESAALDAVTAEAVRRYVATHVPPDEYIQVTVAPR